MVQIIDSADHLTAGELIDVLLERMKGMPPVEVTRHEKGFKKAIGSYIHADQRRRDKIFWFGKDKVFARRAATMVVCLWSMLKESGHSHWPQVAIEAANSMVAQLRSMRRRTLDALHDYLAREGRVIPRATEAPPLATAPVPAPARGALSLAKAREDYLASVKPKVWGHERPFLVRHVARVRLPCHPTHTRRSASKFTTGSRAPRVLRRLGHHHPDPNAPRRRSVRNYAQPSEDSRRQALLRPARLLRAA